MQETSKITSQEQSSWREVHLDIGCGTGGFLKAAARQHPNNLYIGIDINPIVIKNLSHSLGLAQLNNVRVVHSEAVEYLRLHVADGSIAGVHIYFPTPEKRNLDETLGFDSSDYDVVVNDDCFAECHRILRRTGHLRIVTDYGKHFKNAYQLAGKYGFSEVPWSNHLNKRPSIYMIETYWERLAIEMQHQIHRAKFIP